MPLSKHISLFSGTEVTLYGVANDHTRLHVVQPNGTCKEICINNRDVQSTKKNPCSTDF